MRRRGLIVLVAVGVLANVAVVTVSSASTAVGQYATTVTSSGPINPAAVPLGDGYVSTTPKVGYVDACQTSFSSTGGSQVDGPWINTTTRTWDSQTKLSVQGSVAWPQATYSVTDSGSRRIITGNDLPIDHTTGTFPIASSDPAYAYDRNPNKIVPQSIDWSLPLHPTKAAKPSCTNMGAIGILDDGVVLYNALDGEGRDAGAHEVLDSCAEHPDSSDTLHHHDVPPCILAAATGRSTLVGYALDGYGIYVERNAKGQLLTNSDLDACHGQVSRVRWDGKEQVIFHYVATLEYPYTVGCFYGTPIKTSSGQGAGSANGTPPSSTSSIPPGSSAPPNSSVPPGSSLPPNGNGGPPGAGGPRPGPTTQLARLAERLKMPYC